MSEQLQQQAKTMSIHMRHPITADAELGVLAAQRSLAHAVRNHEQYFISVDGPCPLTDTPEITKREADEKVANAKGRVGYIALDRECFFKPRTKSEDWHGMNEDQPGKAYRILSDLAAEHANVVAEVGSTEQLRRYGSALTMMWIGGRNVGNLKLIRALAEERRDIVLGIKNGLDGDIRTALGALSVVNFIRGEDSAPGVLIYRGGTNATTPHASREAYKRAHEATGGKLFYDTAHGTEMAYHPAGNFEKSVVGQELSSQALVELSKQGYAPLGKFSEASAIPKTIDPHMSLTTALAHSRAIHQAKLGPNP